MWCRNGVRGGVMCVWCGRRQLLAAPAPPSLSNDHGLLFVVVIAAADGGNSMCRYRQTSWHVRKVPLTCHVVTAMC
ncbi:hypothetical protein K443DRAFT_675971 [Laccaria amethystina LaAM-08-1]|uniref:Uncharacterized protein n=1 Tax=Laccaria amethystina LaAM-08-1 TaxID=1095629 RepID=A0A0C9XSA3_9AGAR|nr:hypothetical protein K443DRAFT_675971 [Laccaria amethystina LaAM-08-1]